MSDVNRKGFARMSPECPSNGDFVEYGTENWQHSLVGNQRKSIRPHEYAKWPVCDFKVIWYDA